ncbi:MAG: GMP synthase (glutamine-hydrolyzing), partial [Alphaproteobacteria bacterium]|nr:GMP synthase (glutamine-hydrolyzing) [Alphaproteobacteria bacterium]
MNYPNQSERPELFKIMNEEIARVKATVKPGEQVLLALSGGVDSFVTAVMIHDAIGDRLKCVFVDHGGMRKGEADAIKTLFTERFGTNFIAVDASKEYLKAIRGVTDSEELRKIIGKKFIEVFAAAAGRFDNIKYFGQGTIKTDLDESGADGHKFVKTHHNTGIDALVAERGWELVEPLKRFNKEEVRTVGSWLGIPLPHLNRQPFPGPGNYLRVIGGAVTAKDLKTVSEFDSIVRKSIEHYYLPDAKQY